MLWHDNGLVVLETNHSEGQSFSRFIEAVFIPLYVNFAQSCHSASSADLSSLFGYNLQSLSTLNHKKQNPNSEKGCRERATGNESVEQGDSHLD